MVKFAQVVLGPAGSGKSTYCAEVQRYCNDASRIVHVINLDPAAEDFKYNMTVDIRELISADEVAEELEMGPNGALVYCMEFLLENIEWLEEKLDQFIDNDYVVFDLPGQIELYTHFPFMRDLIQHLHKWDFRVQALYFLDSQFMGDTPKFFGGCLTALSCMLQLSVPHINVMSKMDLARGVEQSRVEQYLFPETELLLKELSYHTSQRQLRLNSAMGQLIDSFNMVAFTPLNIADNESIAYLLLQVDQALQFEDEVEIKAREVEPEIDDYDPTL